MDLLSTHKPYSSNGLHNLVFFIFTAMQNSPWEKVLKKNWLTDLIGTGRWSDIFLAFECLRFFQMGKIFLQPTSEACRSFCSDLGRRFRNSICHSSTARRREKSWTVMLLHNIFLHPKTPLCLHILHNLQSDWVPNFRWNLLILPHKILVMLIPCRLSSSSSSQSFSFSQLLQLKNLFPAFSPSSIEACRENEKVDGINLLIRVNADGSIIEKMCSGRGRPDWDHSRRFFTDCIIQFKGSDQPNQIWFRPSREMSKFSSDVNHNRFVCSRNLCPAFGCCSFCVFLCIRGLQFSGNFRRLTPREQEHEKIWKVFYNNSGASLSECQLTKLEFQRNRSLYFALDF